MRELEIERKWQRIYAQRAAGVYPGETLRSEANVAMAGSESELFLLPEDIQSIPDLQGAGGGFVAMLDYSTIGVDPLM